MIEYFLFKSTLEINEHYYPYIYISTFDHTHFARRIYSDKDIIGFFGDMGLNIVFDTQKGQRVIKLPVRAAAHIVQHAGAEDKQITICYTCKNYVHNLTGDCEIGTLFCAKGRTYKRRQL